MAESKEWIVRFYADHDSIPEGHHDGEIVRELIRCKDCKYYFKSDEKCQLIDTRLHFYEANKRWTEDSFCSWAERKTE